jgi:hypothetical protein
VLLDWHIKPLNRAVFADIYGLVVNVSAPYCLTAIYQCHLAAFCVVLRGIMSLFTGHCTIKSQITSFLDDAGRRAKIQSRTVFEEYNASSHHPLAVRSLVINSACLSKFYHPASSLRRSFYFARCDPAFKTRFSRTLIISSASDRERV